jgi:hypothetical protein
MNPEHDRVADWDAAYVLGALSPADRRAYEEHLAECEDCRRAVAELAPTAGLLSRVPAERARTMDAAPPSPPDGLRDGLLRRARQRRARRRVWTLAAAAALALGGVAVPVSIALTAPPASTHALADLADVPLEASVRLTDVAWGTRIDLVCRYSGDVLDAPENGWPYALAVVDADGATTTLSTWRAAPGSTTTLSAGTDLSVADIGAVEIRTIDGADVLMRYEAPE